MPRISHRRWSVRWAVAFVAVLVGGMSSTVAARAETPPFDLASPSSITFAAAPTENVMVPTAISEGVGTAHAGATGAEVWHDDGITGEGHHIAILDFAFRDHEARRGTELPADYRFHDWCEAAVWTPPNEHDHHGTALAEVVHDMAPGAELSLYCINSLDKVRFITTDMIERGVDTVLLGFSTPLEGRGDGSAQPGSLAESIKRGRAAGQSWVVGAGNFAGRVHNFTLTDADGDDIVETRAGALAQGPDAAESLVVTVQPEGRAVIYLKWDDWPPSTRGTVSFCVFDESLAEDDFLGCTGALRTDTPVAGVILDNDAPTAATRRVVMVVDGIPLGVRAQVIYIGDLSAQSPSTSSGSISTPADSPHAFSVGAGCVNVRGQRQPFSSVGPTFDGRTKPDIMAPGSVTTESYGPHTDCSEDRIFTGTSPAAAHVAGALALVDERFPELDAGQRERELRARATVGTLALGDPSALAAADTPMGLSPLSTPLRISDSRNDTGGAPHRFGHLDSATIQFPLYAVPADTMAVAINVTVVGRGRGGHVAVTPAGTDATSTSNVNYGATQTVANHATVRVAVVNGRAAVDVTNFYGSADVIVDLVGAYGPSGTAFFETLRAPVRAVDTRVGTAHSTRVGKLLAAETVEIPLVGVGLPIPAGAVAVAANVTVVDGSGRAHLTVTPGGTVSDISSVNYPPGVAVPNLVVVGLDDTGRIRVTNAPGTVVHVIVDIVGYWSPDGTNGYVGLAPERFVDTRRVLLDMLIDEETRPGPFRLPGLEFTLRGRHGIPATARAVLLNATITRPRGNGYATLWPRSEPQPTTSNINYVRQQTVANSVISGLGGGLAVSSLNATDFVGDVQGYFAPVGSAPDSRPTLDYAEPGGTAQRDGVMPGVTIDFSQPLVEHRRFPTPGSVDELLIVEDDIYVVGQDGPNRYLDAYDASTGNRLFPRRFEPVFGMVATDDSLWLPTTNGFVRLDRRTGAEIWRTGGGRHTSAVVVGDLVVSIRTNAVVAYSRANGAEVWRTAVTVDGTVTYTDGVLLAGDSCLLLWLDPSTGTVQQRNQEIRCSADADRSVRNGTITFRLDGLVDLETGVLLRNGIGSDIHPAVTDDWFYGAVRGSFFRRNTTDYAFDWDVDLSPGTPHDRALVANGYVLLGVDGNNTGQGPRAFEVETGSEVRTPMLLPSRGVTAVARGLYAWSSHETVIVFRSA